MQREFRGLLNDIVHFSAGSTQAAPPVEAIFLASSRVYGHAGRSMVEQLRDMARGRMAPGVFVTRGTEQGLVPLLSRVVDEVLEARLELTLESQTYERPCRARPMSSAPRFERAIICLVENAATHGTPERPISVSVVERGDLVSFSVKNYGRAIGAKASGTRFEALLSRC